MKLHLNISTFVYISFITILFFWGESNTCLAFDVTTFIENFEKNDKQTVLTGHIDTMVIIRGNAEFHLGPGEMTLFDFGWEKPSALVYKGRGRFIYTPPDEIEQEQLKKFAAKEILDGRFKSTSFFFTVELDDMPDTSSFTRTVVDEEVWEMLLDAQQYAFHYPDIYIPNKLIGDLVSEEKSGYFYSDFELKNVGHLVFREDPNKVDYYILLKLIRSGGLETYNIINGYSPNNDLPSQRGVIPIDITHYDINSKIESGGKMTVKCRIYFTPLLSDRRFLYFYWYKKNKVLSAFDSNGDSLATVSKKEGFKLLVNIQEEPGFGLILNKPIINGDNDYIDINYECKSLRNELGLFYIKGQKHWYPQNTSRDRATFMMTFYCPKSYQVISCGNVVESKVENDWFFNKWVEDNQVSFVSFNIGRFGLKEISVEDIPPVKVFIHNVSRFGQVGSDIINSLSFFTNIFGSLPYDTIRVSEIPLRYSKTSPGLIHLSWKTLQFEKREAAHKVAKQWWGQVVDYESYRDAWITEGLSTYCWFWYYQMLKEEDKTGDILDSWRRYIFKGVGAGSMGTKAGPLILGIRLYSYGTLDYDAVVRKKGAYIFHMIRYLFHDFKTGSDELFVDFLKGLIEKYRNKSITTGGLKSVLEESLGDMSWFFDQWVYGIDIPEYRFSYDYEKTPEGKYQVTCHVKQSNVPDDFKMVVPLTVIFENDQFTHLKIWIYQPEQDITLPLLPLEPKKIEFNTYDAVLCNVKYE